MQNALGKIWGRIFPLQKIFIHETLKGTSFGQSALFVPSCVQIGSVVWSVGPYKKKIMQSKVHKLIYFHLSGEPPLSQPIVAIFRRFGDLADLIKSAKFRSDRSKGLCLAGAWRSHATKGERMIVTQARERLLGCFSAISGICWYRYCTSITAVDWQSFGCRRERPVQRRDWCVTWVIDCFAIAMHWNRMRHSLVGTSNKRHPNTSLTVFTSDFLVLSTGKRKDDHWEFSEMHIYSTCEN